MNILFPYPVLDEELTLTFAGITLESSTLGGLEEWDPQLTDAENLTIWIPRTGDRAWDRACVAVEVTVPRTKLEGASAPSNVSVTLIAECRQTNYRRSLRLPQSEADVAFWSGKLEVDPRAVRGVLTVRAVLSGTVNGVANRWLAESERWNLRLDEMPNPFLAGTLTVRWVDFEEDQTYGDLRKHKDDPFYVSLETDEPEVYLNSRIKALREILPRFGKPKGGALLALHESTRTGIARSVWTALFQAALSGIVQEEDEEPQWPQKEWQEKVLQMILPRVYGAEAEPSLAAASEALETGDTRRLVSEALAVISTDILKEGRMLRSAFKAAEATTVEEEQL